MAHNRIVRYSYRAVPTELQKEWLAGAFGAVRVVYNNYLWQKEQVYLGQQSKVIALDRYALLPEEYLWMKEYPQKITEQARRQAEGAYRNFFQGVAGTRKDRPGRPRFKSRRFGGSLTWNGVGSLKLRRLNSKWGAIRIPKQGSWLKFRLTRELPSDPTGVTLKLLASGEYTVSFTVQQELAESKVSGTVAGVDMGLIDLAAVVKDDGSRYKVAAPNIYRRAERKLVQLSRQHARTKKGSKNRERARLALAKQHAHMAAQRLDISRKIAFRLADENQAVSLESLNLRGMGKIKTLAKSFQDAGLGQLAARVEQAANRLGTRFERVNPAYTSQACSVCGTIDGPKPLGTREWDCACGASLDRDYNAALNVLLLAGGHSERLNGSGGRISREELASPVDPAMPAEGATSYRAHKPRRRRTRAKSQARRAQLKAPTSV